ncbi:MAG: NTP transferase domain-containing protein [Bacteroidales bacterium]|nr:NTP transferase domain-containing protein [Bacteroidales bacterium]
MFQAFILSAGLGTRLKPLTNSKPKALVEVNELSLLEHNINKLISYSCKHIVINVHHFSEQIIEHITKKHYACDIFISDETDLLLDTGGGLKNARNLFDFSKDILIHNVDILSKIDFNSFYNSHKEYSSLATLAVSQRQTSRYLLFNENNSLGGWENRKTGERIIVRDDIDLIPYGFSGVQLIKPELIDLIENKDKAFSIIPEYLKLAKSYPINSYIHSKDIWVDVGRIESIEEAEKLYLDS